MIPLALSTMLENTRIIRHQNTVYKVKVKFVSNTDRLPADSVLFDSLESVLRAVLYAEERARDIPQIETSDLIVKCSKKWWKTSEKLGFKQNGKDLEAYPFMLVFEVSFKKEKGNHLNKTSDLSDNVHVETRQIDQRKSDGQKSRTDKIVESGLALQNPVVVLTRENVESASAVKRSLRQSQRTVAMVTRQGSKSVRNTPRLNELPRKLKNSLNTDQNQSNLVKTKNDDVSHRLRSRPRTRNSPKRKISSDENETFEIQVSQKKAKIASTQDIRKSPRQKGPKCPSVGLVKRREKEALIRASTSDELSSSPIAPTQVAACSSKHSAKFQTGSPLKSVKNVAENSSEEARLRNLRSGDVKGKHNLVLPRHKDRHAIEEEEIAEDMKLQNLARTSLSPQKVVNTQLSKSDNKRRSSGFWQILDTLLTPVKMVTRQKSK